MKTWSRLVGLFLAVGLFATLALLTWVGKGTNAPLLDRSPTYHYPLYSHLRIQVIGDLSHGSQGLMQSAYWHQLVGPGAVVVDRRGSSGARLSVEPPLLENGGRAVVSWSGVPVTPGPGQPGRKDWVGVYCPASASPAAYLDYWWANRSQTYARGHGSTEVTLYNLRSECQFRYYSSSAAGTELLAAGDVAFVGGATAPLHAHLALAGRPTEMRVQWTSGDAATPTVLFGTSESELELTATGVSRTYDHADMCGPPANLSRFFVDPGHMHDVLLTGLEPGQRYFYRCGREGAYSKVRSFRAGQAAGDATPFRFVVFGDMDTTPAPGSDTTAELVRQEVEGGASFVLIVGDLSYAVGFAFRWDAWMSLLEPFSSRAPLMVAVGNHDQNTLVGGAKDPSGVAGNGFHPSWGNYGDDSGGECGLPTYRRFHMPGNGRGPWWYSFEHGLVHFTVMSTEHNFTTGSEQRRWLERDLSSVNRIVTPWLVVAGHRPMYTSEIYISDDKVAEGVRRALEATFHRWHVDLALWGHYHSYERSCAMFMSRCSSGGTVHIVVGTGGAVPDSGEVRHSLWSKHLERTYGFGRVSVANRSALLWEFVRNNDRTISDSVWIRK